MDVIGDLVARDRGENTLWIDRPGPRSRSWSGEQFCVDAWKAGNLLRHYGVHEGSTVGVLDGADERGAPSPQALIGLFGAWLLGANVTVNPGPTPDVRALVGPTPAIDAANLPAGSKALGFGTSPEDPTVAHFEGERWSENPTRFPADVGSDVTAVLDEEQSYTHAELLAAGRRIGEKEDLQACSRVGLDGLRSAGEIVAGVIAPLQAGATVALGSEADLVVGETAAEDAIRPSNVRI